MRAKLVNEGYGQKDIVRMEDIQTKSDGDHEKEIKLATTQAKIIKNPAKAKARGEAADVVFGAGSDISAIFHDRAMELGGSYVTAAASRGALKPVTHAPSKGEKLNREFETKFFLPSEKKESSFKRATGSTFRRGGGGNTKQGLGVGTHFGKEEVNREPKRTGAGWILPIGVVNIGSGDSMYWNVKDNFEDGTVEVWEKDDNWNENRPKYRLLFTSGTEIPGVIGDTKHFIHDQSRQDMGNYKLVDWVPIDKINELIRVYGNSIAGAVYK
jgi:hypothetical protein